mgnify:CR=1 FL=1
MSEWIEFSEHETGFADALIWREEAETVLIKNDSENIILRYVGAEANIIQDIINAIENEDYELVNFNILLLENNAKKVTQLGQFSESNIEGVNNRFSIYCHKCESDTKFQVQGKYRGSHAKCVLCGQHASLIIDKCSCSNSGKSLYVKQINEDVYNCYNCNNKYNM